MQNQTTRQQMDTPTVFCGKEQFLDNSFEKVKRRLDLDIDNLQKENYPYVVTTGIAEQERQHLPEKTYSKGSVYIKNKMLESSSKGKKALKCLISAKQMASLILLIDNMQNNNNCLHLFRLLSFIREHN